jgi:hypothetical protein
VPFNNIRLEAAIMATQTEIQELLRFLSKEAKLPLALAMGKVKQLQEAQLTK